MKLWYFSANFALHRERPNAKRQSRNASPSLLPRSRQLISSLSARSKEGEQGRVSLADQNNSTQPLSLRVTNFNGIVAYLVHLAL